MLKRTLVVISAAIIVLLPILLFIPTNYQITVFSSRYTSNCTINSPALENRCQMYDPPQVIEKRQPFIKAWWSKNRIERSFTYKEVTTNWKENGANGLGNNITSALTVTIAFLEIFIVIGTIYLFISTLSKATRLKGNDKIIWICLIIFGFPIGSIAYILINPKAN